MKYGFIGCGNMGSALARALSNSTKDILISDRDSSKAVQTADKLGCVSGDNKLAVSKCDRIFLGVKPQMFFDMLEEIREEVILKKPLLITMAAGIEISAIESFLKCEIPVIRIMPNTPVAVGKGMILYCTNKYVEDKVLESFLSDMKHCGCLDCIDEKFIDAGCSLQGCGPAFMYMFIEALADGAVACGLPRNKAVKYAAATMEGAATMALLSGKHTEELKDEVCSPAGSTIMGVKALEDGGFRAAAMNAVIEAFKRNRSLGK